MFFMKKFVLSRKNVIFLLILILLVGTFLRFYNLGGNPFWFDETWSATSARLDSTDKVLLLALEYDEHPPLQHLIFYWWGKIVGYSEFALRSLSALIGIASILLVFLISKYFFGDKTALISSFIFSLSAAYVEYSQEFRPYMLITFVTLAALYFFIMALYESKAIYWGIFTFFVVLGGNIEYLFSLFIFAIFIFLMFNLKHYKKSLKYIIISFLTIFLLLLPNLFLALFQTSNQVWSQLTLSPLWKILIIPLQFYNFIFGFHSPYLINYNLNTNYLPLLIISLALFTYFSIKGLMSLNSERQKSYLFLCVLLVPIITLYIINIFTYIQMEPKRFLFIAFIFYIIIAKGIASLKNKLLFASTTFILIISVISLLGYYNFDKENWPDLVKYIQDNVQDGDVVGISSSALTVSFNFYNNKPIEVYGIPGPYLEYHNDTLLAAFFGGRIKRYNYERVLITQDNFIQTLNTTIKNYSRMWFIQTRQKNVDPKGYLLSYLNRNYKQMNSLNFSDEETKVYLYKLK
jgi:4-amino-4-deoxy-L-arabinose transferase-like glycosyltransferase